MNPYVVHCKRARYEVYIGRPSKWGNLFRIGRDGTREEVIEKYRVWIRTQPHLLAALTELRGKVLGCWCSPLACHGDVLGELANLPNAVIVTGSRDWTDAAIIRDALLQTQAEWGDFHVLEGGARGTDQLACAIAHELGRVTREFPADWKCYGKRAGTIRNAEMLRIARTEYGRVCVLAFPLPQSVGTRHMIGIARAAKVETREFAPIRIPPSRA